MWLGINIFFVASAATACFLISYYSFKTRAPYTGIFSLLGGLLNSAVLLTQVIQ